MNKFTNNVRKLVNNVNCYNYLMKYSPLFFNQPKKSFHNRKQLIANSNQQSMKTFEGELACGGMSYLLYHYIKLHHQIEIKFLLSSFGYGKYLEDHLYLKIDDFIIDPTYKQFLVINDNSGKYMNHIFNELPMIYVGNNVEKLYKDCQNQCKILTGKDLSDENLVFWILPRVAMTECRC